MSSNSLEPEETKTTLTSSSYKFKIDWLEDSRKTIAAFSQTLNGVKESRQNLEAHIDNFHQYTRQKNKEYAQKQMILKHSKEFPEEDCPFSIKTIPKSSLFVSLGSVVLLEIISFSDRFPFKTALQLALINKKHREFIIKSSIIWDGIYSMGFLPYDPIASPKTTFSVSLAQKGKPMTNSIISMAKTHFKAISSLFNLVKMLKNLGYPSEIPNSNKSAAIRDALVHLNGFLEWTCSTCPFRRYLLSRLSSDFMLSTLACRLMVGDSLPIREEVLRLSCWLVWEVPNFQKGMMKILSIKKIETDIKNAKIDYKATLIVNLLLNEANIFGSVVLPCIQTTPSLFSNEFNAKEVKRVSWKVTCKRESETSREEMSGSSIKLRSPNGGILFQMELSDENKSIKRNMNLRIENFQNVGGMPKPDQKNAWTDEGHMQMKEVIIEEEGSSMHLNGFFKHTRLNNTANGFSLVAFEPDFFHFECFLFY